MKRKYMKNLVFFGRKKRGGDAGREDQLVLFLLGLISWLQAGQVSIVVILGVKDGKSLKQICVRYSMLICIPKIYNKNYFYSC